MVITGIVQPLATIPSITKFYFTHSQHASGQSLTTWSIFAVASLLWVTYGLLNRKPAINVGNIIGLVMNLLMVNGCGSPERKTPYFLVLGIAVIARGAACQFESAQNRVKHRSDLVS
jgi:uncharacterized protein with PQ loop repeat